MSYLYPDAVLMVFCKAPVAGQVKTRLMTEISAEQAVEVYIELCLKTIKLTSQNNLCPVQLWCSPTTRHLFFSAVAQTYNLALWQQQGENLGERMNHAFCTTLDTCSRALLIGCDCPSLTEQDLVQALSALDKDTNCVLAPAEDGGYILIGLTRPIPELFNNIPWGTDQVLNNTRTKLQQLNIPYQELNEQWDLDTPADLARYRTLVPTNPSLTI